MATHRYRIGGKVGNTEISVVGKPCYKHSISKVDQYGKAASCKSQCCFLDGATLFHTSRHWCQSLSARCWSSYSHIESHFYVFYRSIIWFAWKEEKIRIIRRIGHWHGVYIRAYPSLRNVTLMVGQFAEACRVKVRLPCKVPPSQTWK